MIAHRSIRRGSNAIEFALVLPVLVLLTTGIMEYGWYLGQRVLVVNAAREGARAGALTPHDAGPVAEAETGVVQALEQSGFVGNVFVDVALQGDAPHQTISVSVEVPYAPLTGFVPIPDLIVSRLLMRMEDQSDPG